MPQHENSDHEITVTDVENDFFISVQHEMTKVHSISFAAYVSSDRVLFIKLYPEQAAEIRFPKMYGGDIYIYCSKHGLIKRGKVMCKFHPIDMQTWPMAQTFYYYTQIAPTGYTVNVNMDVTILRKTLKARGCKFFPAYLYLVSRTIAKQQELRMAVKNNVLGFWDYLTPVYPQFHKDDGTTSLLWTEYNDNFTDFYEQYISDTRQHGQSHGILSSKGVPEPNSYVISCIPWFTFNSFSLYNHGVKDYYFPSFEAGKFIESGDRLLMPLSVTVHHATTEGYHLKVFFEELQRSLDIPEEWL